MRGIGVHGRPYHTLWGQSVLCLLLGFCLLLVCTDAQAADLSTVIYAEAPGIDVLAGGKVIVDVSNASLGYFMIRHSGSDKRLKARTTFDGQELQYNMDQEGEYIAIPFQFGSGTYKIEVLEHVEGDTYAQVYAKNYSVELVSPYAAFLVPNQRVWYTPDTQAVALSFQLCEGIEGDMEKAKALYSYVGDTIHYDFLKASQVTSNKLYLPDVDETLQTQFGICYDYASLLACMLRVQGIPTQLVMGDKLSMNQAHAWNKVYIDGNWYLLDPTFKNAGYDKDDYVEDRFY